MCGPKGYANFIVFVRNRVLILAILVLTQAWFLHSSLELGMFFRSYFFIIINWTVINTQVKQGGGSLVVFSKFHTKFLEFFYPIKKYWGILILNHLENGNLLVKLINNSSKVKPKEIMTVIVVWIPGLN